MKNIEADNYLENKKDLVFDGLMENKKWFLITSCIDTRDVEFRGVECRGVECRGVECRGVECRGVVVSVELLANKWER